MPRKPNVLFLISDQHSAKCLGAAGHPIVKTPNLDRLAAEGVTFTNAITQNPICTPSRVSFFSGQYPHNHGYYGLGGPTPASLPTVLGHFRANGYRTAMIGKVHCPGDWVQRDSDVYLGAYADGDYTDGRELSPYDEYLKARDLLHLRDDDMYPEQKVRTRQSKDARPSKLPYEHSVEGWCVHEARKFIEDAGDAPWFMQVSFPRPHQIYSPAERFWEMVPADLPMPPNADADMSLKPPHMRAMLQSQKAGREEYLFGEKTYEALRRRKLRGYYALVTQTDFAVGQLLDSLKQRGIEQDTIVIYTTDHGEYACEFGLLEKAPGICSDAVTRIPSLWRWPGRIRRGHVCDRIVETVDLATTVTRLADLPEFCTGDGQDITPLLRGEDVELHRIGVTENPLSKSIRKGLWRLVVYPAGMFASESPDRPVGELYDLDDDPWEMNNLFYDPACRARVAEMQADLLSWLVTTTRVATAHPGVAPPGPDGKVTAETVLRLCQGGNLNYL